MDQAPTLRKYYKNKRVLIAGGAGFIGSNIASQLAKLDARVTVVDPFLPECGANRYNLKDVGPKGIVVEKKIEKFLVKNNINKYNIAFNCAGLTDHHLGQNNVELDYLVNCFSGLSILEHLAKRKSECRLISLGSRSQYGRTDATCIDEAHPLRPVDVHSVHKTTLEYYHDVFRSCYGLDLLYVRLTNVYGPGQRLRGEGIGALGEIIRSGISGKDALIYGSLDRIKDILFVNDVVRALLLLGMKTEPEYSVYNLGGSRTTMAQIVSAIDNVVKLNARVIPFPGKIKKLDTGDVVLNIGRIKKETGWMATTSVVDGMSGTIRYYKENMEHYL